MTYLKTEEIENLTKEQRDNLGIKLIRGDDQNDRIECRKLAWIFFLDYHNQPSAFSLLQPDQYKENIQTHRISKHEQESKRKEVHNKRKKLNDNTIDKCYKVWIRTNFLSTKKWTEKRKRENNRPKKLFTMYKFSLSPFFTYYNKKLTTPFTKEEEKILELIFLPNPVRSNLYKDYGETDFLEALLKYYTRFYIYYLRNPIRNKREHYFNKDFFNVWIYSNAKKGWKYDERNDRIYTVTAANKESRIIDAYDKKMQFYEDPNKPIIFNLTPIGRKVNKSDRLMKFSNNYYSVYESLHILYKEIMEKLDAKMIELLLRS